MSWLGILNFGLLQWFGVRLQLEFSHICEPDEKHRWWDREVPAAGTVGWSLLRWVWPLTGWWSEYRYIKKAK